MGPIVTSSKARDNELEISLLERLLNRPLYSRYVKDLALGMRSIKPIANLVKVSYSEKFHLRVFLNAHLELSKPSRYTDAAVSDIL